MTCASKQRPRGTLLWELELLPIPEQRWDTISVNFIIELPEAHRYDAVMNIVDFESKWSHFLPTNTTVTTLGAAQLYLTHIWKLHGLSKQVISDQGPQFAAEFTQELYRLLSIKLAATTAYHPQGDSQKESVNQELEQYLHLFVN